MRKEVNQMDCHQISKLLLDYREGDLSDSVFREVEEHLRQCEVCAKKYARMEKMVNLMKTMPSISPSPGIVQNVMRKLEEEEEEEERLGSRNFFIRFKILPKKVLLAAVTVMVLAAVLYGMLTFFIHRSPLQFQSWAATVQAAPYNLEESAWWAWRKKAADEMLLPEDRNVGIIFGGILEQPQKVNIEIRWTKPDGILFQKTTFRGNVSAGLCIFMSNLTIDDIKPINNREEINESSFRGEITYSKIEGFLTDFPGIWHLEIFINNRLQTTLQIEV
jgi:hypothetical protein